MNTDERQIRELVAMWMAATKSGDVDKVLDLTADDVVFLVPGRSPMFKSEFASALKAQAGHKAPTFDGKSEIQDGAQERTRQMGDCARCEPARAGTASKIVISLQQEIAVTLAVAGLARQRPC